MFVSCSARGAWWGWADERPALGRGESAAAELGVVAAAVAVFATHVVAEAERIAHLF